MVQKKKAKKTKQTIKEKRRFNTKRFLKLLLGIIFILGGLASYIWWWSSLWVIFKGLLGIVVIIIGILIILISSD